MNDLLISATHGLLRPEIMEIARNVEFILHAGDINNRETYETLQQFGTLTIVRGNNDKEWAEMIPSIVQLRVEEVNILIVHNKKDIPKELGNVQLIVVGHSHKYHLEEKETYTILNPGSCGKRRFDQEITYAILYIHGQVMQIEKHTIE